MIDFCAVDATSPSTAVVAVFVRQPLAGQVKSRLAAAIGPEAAAEFYRACVTDVLASLALSGLPGEIAYSPDTAAARDEFSRRAPAGWMLWAQPEGSLGERLLTCVRRQFDAGAERVLVLGSDAPSLPRSLLVTAADELANHDVVLGPAVDGGYCLIGMRRPSAHPTGTPDWSTLFEGIDWGGPHVRRQTVERVRAAGLSLALLPPWYDVDTLSDLQFLQAHLEALAVAGQPCPCPHTAAWLNHRECR